MSPKLSIITINYNNAKGLEKTIQSVINQTFTAYQYIVIDADSTDGSKEILKKYSNKITHWVSEPDTGIYNGMNKGIKFAKGEYCLFLNAGDKLVNQTILRTVFEQDFGDAEIIYGDLLLDTNNTLRVKKYPSKVDVKYLYLHSLPHPSMLIKSKLFSKYGLYREDLKIVSDWEYYFRLFYKEKVKLKHLAYPVAIFDLTGMSSIKINQKKIHDEREKVITELIQPFKELFDVHLERLMKERESLDTEELLLYQNSRLIQFVKKVLDTPIYKFLRK